VVQAPLALVVAGVLLRELLVIFGGNLGQGSRAPARGFDVLAGSMSRVHGFSCFDYGGKLVDVWPITILLLGTPRVVALVAHRQRAGLSSVRRTFASRIRGYAQLVHCEEE
jgi:hypothetical protein